jgi:hypothetical protein
MNQPTSNAAPKSTRGLMIVCGIIIAACLVLLFYFRSLSLDQKGNFLGEKEGDGGLVPYRAPDAGNAAPAPTDDAGNSTETSDGMPAEPSNTEANPDESLPPPGN